MASFLSLRGYKYAVCSCDSCVAFVTQWLLPARLPPCRTARRRGEVRPGERGSDAEVEGAEAELRYPENISLPNLAYFAVAPTLCYQPTYPRRWAFRSPACKAPPVSCG
jgi:hypothetical protein